MKDLFENHSQYEKLFKNQCSIMSEMNHPNIVKFFGHTETNNYLDNYLVYEYLPGGTLYDKLFNSSTSSQDQLLTSTHRLSLAIDVAKGIAFQHGINITDWSLDNITYIQNNLPQIEVDTKNNQTNLQIPFHKDIKLQNVLLSGDMTAKLRNTSIDQLTEEMITENPPFINNGYIGNIIFSLLLLLLLLSLYFFVYLTTLFFIYST